MPLKRCGAVSERMSVWLSGANAALKASNEASRGSMPLGSSARKASSPCTIVSDARLRVPASVKWRVP